MIKHEFREHEGIITMMPAIANHFVKADVRHFDVDGLDSAVEWIKQDSA